MGNVLADVGDPVSIAVYELRMADCKCQLQWQLVGQMDSREPLVVD